MQDRLRARYLNGGGHPNATAIQVRVAPDPQLAVCKGLVGDRLRKLKAGKPVLKWRCCRASYGTICKEIYSKDNPLHIGRPTTKDPMNSKLYVTQSIAWFIKKVRYVMVSSTTRAYTVRANRSALMSRSRIASTERCRPVIRGEPFRQVSSSPMRTNSSYPITWVPEVCNMLALLLRMGSR